MQKQDLTWQAQVEVEEKSNLRHSSGIYILPCFSVGCECPETAPRVWLASDGILIETQSQLYGHFTAENWHFTWRIASLEFALMCENEWAQITIVSTVFMNLNSSSV